MIQNVCVYCASSSQIHEEYLQAAFRLGQILAHHGISIACGGGGSGSMGYLADGALAGGGKVFGVLPDFMVQLEWAHPKLTELIIVESMHQRKQRLLVGADAVIAMPGGSGTFDELFETISLKRLGFYLNPIILLNIRDYFDPCIRLLEQCISERFMHPQHREMWTVVQQPSEVLPAIEAAPRWSEAAVKFAVS